MTLTAGRALLLSQAVVAVAAAQDWPTYRADNARSGVARSALTFPLEPSWVWSSPHEPRRAWPGPAKRDAYNKVFDLVPRASFDAAFQVVVAAGKVFFGSSADDQLRCLDASTGKQVWTFFAEAPLRFAPTWHEAKLYFGADDGYAYCVDAVRGRLIWRHRPGPSERRVPGNGRMMSVWPVRSGIVIVGTTAYLTAGLFASEGSYLCALDTSSGRPLWQHRRTDLNPQGYMLASRTNLYVTTGRGRPFVFKRETGKLLSKEVGGQGGTFALLDGDSLIYGPGKTGQLGEFGGKRGDHIATFRGLHMIVNKGTAFLQTRTELSCLARDRYLALLGRQRALRRERDSITKTLQAKRKSEPAIDQVAVRRRLTAIAAELAKIADDLPSCVRWRQKSALPLDLILAGDVLIAAGDGRIAAFSTKDGSEVWSARVPGRVYGLAVANGSLFASTDRGAIHCFGRTR